MKRTTHLSIFGLISFLLWLVFNAQSQSGAIGQTIPHATPTATFVSTVMTATLTATGTPTASPTATPTSFPSPIPPQPTSTAAPTGVTEAPCTYNPWRFTTNMTTKRYDHALAVANNHLYALGDYTYSGVERALIHADGTLGLWQRENRMIFPRHAPAVVVHNDFLYVLGGTGNVETSTEYAPVNADGSLGTWQPATPMVKPRRYLAAVTANGYLYAIGGDDETPSTVERTQIHADGSLGAWELIGTMNVEHHSRNALIIDNFIYVIGDSQSAGQAGVVERAALNPDGTLGSWQMMGSLPVSRASGATLTANGAIYLFGGYTNGVNYNTVLQLPLQSNGGLGAAIFLNAMHRERQGPAAVIDNGRVYVSGGNDYRGSNTEESVEWANLADLGAPHTNGVSINSGALYTNDTAVTLYITGQNGVIEMQVSNDGGFAGAVWEPCLATKAWEITRFGNSILPRTVYIRYRDDQGNVSNTVQDDIILDITAPTGKVTARPLVSTAQAIDTGIAPTTVQPQPSQQRAIMDNPVYLPLIATNRDNCPATGAPTATLTLDAQDDVSGVSAMLISNRADFACARWRPFATSAQWYAPPGATTTVYVKFRDNAGNVSAVAQDTVTLGGTE